MSILLVVNSSNEQRHRAHADSMRWWGYQPQQRDWQSAAVLFVGTLLFAVSLVAAFAQGLTPRQSDGWIWLPDILGCVCFLVSGHLAMLDVGAGHVRVLVHVLTWWVVAINQLGSVLFFLAGVAAFVRPATSSEINAGTRQLGNLRRRGLLRHRRAGPALRQANYDTNGGRPDTMNALSQSAAETLFGNRFLTERAPSTSLPSRGDGSHRRSAAGGRGPQPRR